MAYSIACLIKTVKKYVVNNRMNDIKNQIAFITEGNNSAFSEVGIPSVEMVLKKAQTVFNKWSALDEEERTTEAFTEMMDVDYFKLLDTITIARSRKHIQKYYDTADIGTFPVRLPPISKSPRLTDLENAINYNEIFEQLCLLSLCIYTPTMYILPSKVEKYMDMYDSKVFIVFISYKNVVYFIYLISI